MIATVSQRFLAIAALGCSSCIMQMAEARFALLEANVTAAEALLREAIKVEDGGGYTEPPRLGSQPVRQCLGAVILHHGRIGEALKVRG